MDIQQLIKEGFDKEQLEYQDKLSNQGAQILKKNNMVYLAMEMRVGKTFTAMMICKKVKRTKVFMISKKKALYSLTKDAYYFTDDFDFVCTNFEQLHNIDEFRFDGEDFFNPDIIIIDEAHSLGQFPKPAERTKLLKEICKDLPIIYLSGTPTPESYSQIFHQFFVSSYSPFKEYQSFYRWADDFVQVRERYLGQIRIKDYSGAYTNIVKEKIDHLFISLTQAEAGFKQEIMEKFITVPMQESTWYLFDTLIEDRVYEANDGSVILAETEVKLQNKLHQISSGTVIVDKENSKVFDFSKAHYIRDNYKGKKIAVYYKFVAEWGALVGTFGYDKLTDDPKAFNESDDLIFCSQVQSGREGVNLSSADIIIMYNIDFSSASYFQIRSRSQTKNRDRVAEVHWLFSDKGLERKIYESVVNKKDYTLSYFKNDWDVKSVVREFKASNGTKIKIWASTTSEAVLKQHLFKMMDDSEDENFNSNYNTKSTSNGTEQKKKEKTSTTSKKEIPSKTIKAGIKGDKQKTGRDTKGNKTTSSKGNSKSSTSSKHKPGSKKK